jgi:hypothetical protein
MVVVMSDRNRAICFSKLGDWRACSNRDWLLKDVGDGECWARVRRRESWILNSGFVMESLHVQR